MGDKNNFNSVEDFLLSVHDIDPGENFSSNIMSRINKKEKKRGVLPQILVYTLTFAFVFVLSYSAVNTIFPADTAVNNVKIADKTMYSLVNEGETERLWSTADETLNYLENGEKSEVKTD